ncbi:fatty-acid peroxygenase [Noviherbaspirillum humi]|uniref:Fatty-acid peroxygenase n=1 Tax=Noviherbaspirillum humi TaxID=1688639 RepID=A0A239DP10_9BURK|nr:cytochrome P450 [Noviherbaspirillum humi]SNS33919.1 fatty-acid peroxygenase [Noviherbaspirillum humi]
MSMLNFQAPSATGDAASSIPREPGLDHTRALLREGYRYMPNRFAAHGTDIFATRLMFQSAICVYGESAARMFYTPGRFTRKLALPPNALLLLQDLGSVVMRDGEAHHRRKEMFMALMAPDSVQRLMELSAAQWRSRFAQWQGMSRIVLHEEAQAVLCRAACEWAGVPLDERTAVPRTREFAAMIDGAGTAGPRNWRGLMLRRHTERWARALIEEVRAGKLQPPAGSALAVMAGHEDSDGRLLDVKVAAVELINVLRPTVAVARFIVFGALAMHEHPEMRAILARGDAEFMEMFAQEVRRYYPFIPAVGGRALQAFDWSGHHFRAGDWVLLDLYGTNHDARLWRDPEAFRPERFRGWRSSGFDLIPQGAGDPHQGHRCPGEDITVGLLKTALCLLAGEIDYDVPQQDLSVPLSRMPTLPASGFVISRIRARRPAGPDNAGITCIRKK